MYLLITLFLIIWSFTEPNTHRPGQPETTWPIRTKDIHVSVLSTFTMVLEIGTRVLLLV